MKPFADYVCANMFDGQPHGKISMSVVVLLNDLQEMYDGFRRSYDSGPVEPEDVANLEEVSPPL